MSKQVYDQIKEGMEEALKVARGEQTLVICPHCGKHVMWLRTIKDDPKPPLTERGAGYTSESTS